MTEAIGSVFIEITLDDKKYTAQLQAVGKESEKAGKQVGDNLSKGANQATTSFQQMETVVKGLMYKLAALYSVHQITSFVKETALVAARFETLGIVMTQVAKINKVSTETIKEQEMALRKQGISMTETRSNLTKMMQAQIDTAQASKLARIAQDAAVIGDINSSEAFGRMIHGIKSGQTEILRIIGLQVSNEAAYKKLADTLKITTGALTENQKVQARVNAVMEEGAKITGVYEAAMGTAGKKLNSFKRYIDDFKVKMGEAFGPAMVILVDAATEAMKKLQIQISAPQAQEAMKNLANDLSKVVKILIEEAPGALEKVVKLLTSVVSIYNGLPAEVITGGIGVIGALMFHSTPQIALMVGAIAVYTTFMNRVAAFATTTEKYAEGPTAGIANNAIVKGMNYLDSINPIANKVGSDFHVKNKAIAAENLTRYNISRAKTEAVKKPELYGEDALEKAKRSGVTFDSEATRFRNTYSPADSPAVATKEQIKAKLDAEKKYYEAVKFDDVGYYKWKSDLIEKEKVDKIKEGASAVIAEKLAQQEILKLNMDKNKILKDESEKLKYWRNQVALESPDLKVKTTAELQTEGGLEKYLKDVDTIMERERAKSEAIGELALMDVAAVEKASKEKIDTYQNLYGMLDSKTKESTDFQISLLDKQRETYSKWAELNIKDGKEQILIQNLITEAFKQQKEKVQELQDLKTGDMYTGFRIGVKQWTETAETAAEGMARVTKQAFNDMTSALTKFVRTGKMDWKSLADSIVDELIRIQIQQAIVYATSGGKEGGGGLLGGVLKIAGLAMSAYSGGATAASDGIAMSSMPNYSAKGNIFDKGKITPFASGGIFSKPTLFPMANGTGLMGEAGPEAVMPLTRGSDGKLGVKAKGGDGNGEGTTNIIINAVDAKSFEDMCKRNPAAITGPILQSLRDNKTRTEFKRLIL